MSLKCQEECVRAYFWHTNTAEGYFSILKRGIMGTYHHVSSAHLHRYLAEFDYRYNERQALGVDDATRMETSSKASSASGSPIGGLVSERTSKPKLTRRQFRAILDAIKNR